MKEKELKKYYWSVVGTLLEDEDYFKKAQETEKQKILFKELDELAKQLGLK